MKRRFVPRTAAECQQAVGYVHEPELSAALHVVEDTDAPRQLFKALSKPKPGDWLYTKEELGQSFQQYSKRMDPKAGGSLPRPACDGLLICPLGASFSCEIGQRFMPHLVDYYSAFFPGMFVEVLEKPMSLKSVQSRENDFGHKQYLIGDIFTMLNTHKDITSHRRAYARLGVTLEDIYPGDDWNYVFGQARPLERVGVFSFARHSPLFYEGVHAKEAAEALTTTQMLSWLRTNRHTMVHETCHMLGILHCVYWKCLMNGNNGPGDSNGGHAFLCPVCLHKLMHAVSALNGPPRLELVDKRYANMQAILQALEQEYDCSSPGLQRDLEWLEFRRAQLEEIRQCPPPPPPHAASPVVRTGRPARAASQRALPSRPNASASVQAIERQGAPAVAKSRAASPGARQAAGAKRRAASTAASAASGYPKA